MSEASDTFGCFGSTCGVWVIGDGPGGPAADAVAAARRSLLSWHDRFTRFTSISELSRLNRDPRPEVPVSSIMARFVAAALAAAEDSGGLVDPTQLGAIEAAGYREDLRTPVPLELALRLGPPRRPAQPNSRSRWQEVEVDLRRRVIRRPAGVALDSGGIVKGMLADVLAERLSGYESFAINCAGDLWVGGIAREVQIPSPFHGGILHTFELADAGVATSGIGRRSWLQDGRPMHHLLDPATGQPAFTGVVQATAIAATAMEAERLAKAAILSGPSGAPRHLPHGGLLVFEDGSHQLITAGADIHTGNAHPTLIGVGAPRLMTKGLANVPGLPATVASAGR